MPEGGCTPGSGVQGRDCAQRLLRVTVRRRLVDRSLVTPAAAATGVSRHLRCSHPAAPVCPCHAAETWSRPQVRMGWGGIDEQSHLKHYRSRCAENGFTMHRCVCIARADMHINNGLPQKHGGCHAFCVSHRHPIIALKTSTLKGSTISHTQSRAYSMLLSHSLSRRCIYILRTTLTFRIDPAGAMQSFFLSRRLSDNDR